MKLLKSNAQSNSIAVKEMRSAGKSYPQIAEYFREQGYVNKAGKPINHADIKFFMKSPVQSTGKRKYVRTGKHSKRIVDAHDVKVVRTYLQDVEDIVTSNLAPQLKERILKQLGG